MRALSTLLAALSLAFLASCSNPTSGSTQAANCDASPAACGCHGDGDCSGANPRCDLNSGKCVACLPAFDNCPAGHRCQLVDGAYSCSIACASDADCPRSDAGNAERCCGGACVDVASDPFHCGACDNTCPPLQNASAVCSAGACALGACKPGHADCDGVPANGCEVDTTADVKNCGGCNQPCAAGPHQSGSCMAGACTLTCDTGFAHCSMNAADGCEVDITSDLANCGACNNACPPLANATVACQAGACQIGQCAMGFNDCNHDPKDGCEANTGADPANCGGCGQACNVPNAMAACLAGFCGVASCKPGFLDCDRQAIDGCEVAAAVDPMNCGACGHVCMGFNNVPGCGGGQCTIGMCNPGFADCDGRPEDGCEVALTSDVMNCGACGKACPMIPNATPTCTMGVCALGQCNPGFADCDMNPMNGCEANLNGPQNCGQCGNVCAVPANATPGCNMGQCGIGMCKPLFGDCDMNPMNGCEHDLSADPANCGKCGAACAPANAQGQCQMGQCTIAACNPGFADCDMKAANGCEININTDLNNCGKCGNVCPQGTQNCTNGQCIRCGNDCWGPTGCLTAQGRCIQFTCRAGNAGQNFCNGCKGWKDVTYDQWMNQGYCQDVTAIYRANNGSQTKCGWGTSCCNGSNNCSGYDNAWHFFDPVSGHNYLVGPSLGNFWDNNCRDWNQWDDSGYSRLTVCVQ